MIGSAIGGIDAMIGGKEDGVARLHHSLHAGEPVIHLAQRLSIALTITTMAPEHIEFYQINEEQAGEVSLQPAQRCGHALAIRACMLALCQAASGKNSVELAEADHVLAGRLEQ